MIYILHQVHHKKFSRCYKTNDKIKIYLQGEYPHDPGGTNICQLKKYLEKLYTNVSMLFKDKLPRDLHIAFEIMKLLIKRG